MSSVRLGTSREKGPFCYEPGECLDLHRCLIYCLFLKIRILVKFLKGHWGFWIPNNLSSTAHSSASIVCITFLLCNPCSLLLPPYCTSVFHSPNSIKSEIEWHWPGNTQPDFCCLNTAPEVFGAYLEKQGHCNTLVRMDADSHMHAIFCWLLCWDFGCNLNTSLWGFCYHWIQKKINDRLNS